MKRAQKGFALIAAIVLIVILAAMAGFVASMVGGQSANQQLERMSRVTDLAARAGLEWGAYQVLRPVVPPVCPLVTPMPLSLPGSLNMVPVTVSCTSALTIEGGIPVTIYRITATATYGGVNTNPDFVERRKTAVFTR